jgi:hypothetical protein
LVNRVRGRLRRNPHRGRYRRAVALEIVCLNMRLT